jgi:hypothetical protein
MYGMSAFGLARQLGIGRGEAQDYIALYFSRFSGVRDYMERVRAQAREDGFVETVFGRRLYLPEIRARNQAQRAGAERAAINAPMQGTAADIIKRAMVAVDAWLEDGANARALMLMQVHDELVFEAEEAFVPELLAQVKLRMEWLRNCACRWWSIPAWVRTGTKRTEVLGHSSRFFASAKQNLNRPWPDLQHSRTSNANDGQLAATDATSVAGYTPSPE